MNKSSILLSSINQFYKDQHNRNKLLTILNKSGGISLRNLEWFITNYAKKNHTSFKTKDGKMFAVHCAYKSSLDGYSKKLFDPFCRAEKFTYQIPETSEEIQTTLAQLNFIKWVIKNSIFEFIQEHRALFKSCNQKPVTSYHPSPV
jgi:hypothetical protein